MPFGSPESRKQLLTMVLLVLALDAVAITAYFALAVAQRPQQIQIGFVVGWTLLTLAIVAVYLRRIRQLRDAVMRRRR